MNKKIVVACALLTLGQTAGAKQERPILTSPILKLIDGKSYAINRKVYGFILAIRLRVRKMLVGERTADGSYVGLYIFEGNPVSITDLTLIESKMDGEPSQEFYDLLAEIKDEILEVTGQYIDNIRGFKAQILALIQESCDRNGISDCFLLKWAEEEEGEEGTLLQAEINTFEEIKKFCNDLIMFLGDMARSCKKGRQLFMELIKK